MKSTLLTTSAFLLALTACGGGGGGGGGGDSSDTPTEKTPTANSPARFSGELSASITTEITSTAGTASVADIDAGESRFQVQTNTQTTYGNFSITEVGAWVFKLNQGHPDIVALLDASSSVTEKVTLISIDGSTTNLTINIAGVNNYPATFSGDLSAELTISSGVVSGKAVVTDLNAGEDIFQTTASAQYGTFTLSTSGDWQYNVNKAHEHFSSWSSATDVATDTIVLTSADGSSTNLVITIKGQDTSISPALIWSAEPEKSTKVTDFFRRLDSGNYPQDYCVVEGDEAGVAPSTAGVVTDENLGKVWRINKPKNRKRGEFARIEGDVNTFSPQEGDDIYIAWQWKINTEDNVQINEEVTVFQWKSAGEHNQNYPINMEYDGDLTLNAWGADYVGNQSYASRRTVLWRKAVPQNEWVSLVVRIRLNKGDFGGLVQFWFNGEQQALDNLESVSYRAKLSDDKKTVFHRTNDGSFVYPKWGAYNKKSCAYNINAYFHDMKVGTSLSSVLSN